MKLARKDKHPKETVENIKDIFKRIGIEVEESYHIKHDEYWYSVRVELKKLKDIGVNGKGINKDLALASAYGELIERVQTQLLLKPYYSKKKSKSYRLMDNHDGVFNENILKELFSEDIEITKGIKDEIGVIVAPYYDVFNKCVRELPAEIIEKVTGSNGICAGNTPEEAISHGICEIFERYVHKEIMKGKYILPTIPLTVFEGTVSEQMIKELEQREFTVKIKDCTLNGQYPVIGLLVLNKNKSKYFFHVGSDLDMDIALQRCITEMFQGVSMEELEGKRLLTINYKDYLNFENDWTGSDSTHQRYNEWIKTVTAGKGFHPIKVFIDCKFCEENLVDVFLHEEFTNKTALVKLTEIIEKLGLDIYVRDQSFLGFPTYRVFINKITDISKKIISENRNNKNNIYDKLYNINKLKEIELMDVCEYITLNRKNPSSNMIGVLNNTYRVKLNDENGLEFDDNYLLFKIYFKLNKYDQAYESLRNMIMSKKSNIGVQDRGKFISALSYIRNKQAGVDEKSINSMLKGIDSEESYLEILQEEIILPKCPDCSKCKFEDRCNYDIWEEEMKKIMDNEICISHEKLLEVFSYVK